MATVRAMAAVAVALTLVVACWFIVHPEAFVSPGPTLRHVSIGCGPGPWTSVARRNSVPYVCHPNLCGKVDYINMKTRISVFDFWCWG